MEIDRSTRVVDLPSLIPSGKVLKWRRPGTPSNALNDIHFGKACQLRGYYEKAWALPVIQIGSR